MKAVIDDIRAGLAWWLLGYAFLIAPEPMKTPLAIKLQALHGELPQ